MRNAGIAGLVTGCVLLFTSAFVIHGQVEAAAWQWPGLMVRRTAVQQPRFYWRGRALGGSSTVNVNCCAVGNETSE